MDKPKRILVDDDALIALAKEDDSNHKTALVIAHRIQKDLLIASPLTIPEAATVISHKVSHEKAKVFLKNARQRTINITAFTPELEKLADDIFLSQKVKGTSWPDCLNIAIVHKLSIDAIFSFDEVYHQNHIPTLS